MLVADVASPYQNGFDVDAYADAGGQLLIIKASEGAGYRNPKMGEWRDAAHRRGLYVWLYHFLRDRGQAESDNFLVATGGLQPGEVAVCDWEDTADGEQCRAWCAEVEAATGRRPVIYSYGPYLQAHDTSSLTHWPLWIAAYGPNDGQEHGSPNTDRWAPFEEGPGVWPHEGKSLGWQFTSRGSGRVGGFDGTDLDVSRFDLTALDLARMGGGHVDPPPVDPWPIERMVAVEMVG